MDWNIILTALCAAGCWTGLLGTLFAFIRANDMKNIDAHIARHDEEVNKKLDEQEFRRFEVKNEYNLRTMNENTRNDIKELNTKIDDKFDKLYDKIDELGKKG